MLFYFPLRIKSVIRKKECLLMFPNLSFRKIKTILFMLIFLFNAFSSNASAVKALSENPETVPAKPYTARVISIISDEKVNNEDASFEMPMSVQILELKILSGPHAGTTVTSEYNYEVFEDIRGAVFEEGDKVVIYIDEDSKGNIINVNISELVRQDYLLYLTIGFVLLLILFGGIKGLKSFIALTITVLAVVKVMLPAILSGANPIYISVAVCIGVIVITLLIVSGLNNKTLAAIIGCAGGVVVAGIIALAIGSAMKLTGLADEEARMLLFIPQKINFNFQGLLFAGIIVGAMGAAMDVGISIASSINEIVAKTEGLSVAELFKAGMNIGRDIMGTMSNTLILAYAGGSLQLLLLLLAYDISFFEIINREPIVVEVLRALAGSIGLLFTIPITSIAASILLHPRKKVSN
jgi:uncharacterized membrane protein